MIRIGAYRPSGLLVFKLKKRDREDSYMVCWTALYSLGLFHACSKAILPLGPIIELPVLSIVSTRYIRVPIWSVLFLTYLFWVSLLGAYSFTPERRGIYRTRLLIRWLPIVPFSREHIYSQGTNNNLIRRENHLLFIPHYPNKGIQYYYPT